VRGEYEYRAAGLCEKKAKPLSNALHNVDAVQRGQKKANKPQVKRQEN